MATTLPRPARPSLGPPNTPLPSLPVSKSRKPPANNPTTPSESRRESGSLLPTTGIAQRAVSSALPQRPPSGKKNHGSTSTLPGGTPNPAGKLRKTISIGAFPQPPTSGGTSPDGPLSAPSQRHSDVGTRGTSGLKKRSEESSLRQSAMRQSSMRTTSYSNGTSFLNGGGGNAVSLMSLPSPPASRSSSPPDSAIENDGEEPRGRSTAEEDKLFDEKHGKDGKGNVIVSVRVRPDQAPSERDQSDVEWLVDGRHSHIAYRGREGGDYSYDNVFSVNDKNGKVYDASAKRLVRRVMEGYHGTVFAYGMTGTGKTFSMQGTATSPGIIPLAITDIFSFIRETPQREFLLRVSYLEIYNEKIHDLLAGQPGPGVPQEEIKLREDSKRGVYATPLKEEIVQSPTQLLRVIARGDLARRVAGTQFNARSSRSHAVVQIVVESRERISVNSSAESKRQALLPGGVRVSTLSLIDLAGSERAAEDKERRTEGAHINKSLLTLGTVIGKLSVDKDNKHLPYRDSKLTRLLQPALSGGALISILCTIQIGSAGSTASAQNHTLETLNTLKFASRAKNNIVSHAKKAEDAFGGAGDAGSRALLDRYRMEIDELKKQLMAQGKKEKPPEKEEESPVETAEVIRVKEMEHERRHEEQMLEMQLARTALKERIEHLNRLILSSKSVGVNNSRSMSQMSNNGRQSVMTNGDVNGMQSARSSVATLSPPILNRNSSSGSMRSFRQSTASTIINEVHREDEEDSMGENGDGNATAALQVRALQADLADKNRYISTLEKRLLQARRSSHSRVSMSFGQRTAMGEDGVWESLVREKDGEIAELRARLDDKERMVSALRSAARKRDVADLTVDTAHASPGDRRSNSSSASLSARPHTNGGGLRGNSASSRISATSPRISSGLNSPLGITGTGGGEKKKKTKSVDEMTKLLDEMITERVHNGNSGSIDRKCNFGWTNGQRRDEVQEEDEREGIGTDSQLRCMGKRQFITGGCFQDWEYWAWNNARRLGLGPKDQEEEFCEKRD
ncbi:hypothetical protein BLS_004316 [Venturia inaequalis]|uniref:Kinesin-like protein KIP2 n=1 Tax=Venturia inaequalis TaxID=5025 RepID=A0A8H3ULK6_VENIN|nr:hypothetical protein BLS_004316 [Venturia inaequalis]RDI81207.1 hypothetical protein Vi05172_g8847 [Venturia inaequalis]